jgi:hypothetical protein
MVTGPAVQVIVGGQAQSAAEYPDVTADNHEEGQRI